VCPRLREIAMARRPARSTPRSRRPAQAAAPSDASSGSQRERVIATFMELLAEKRLEQIGLGEIAERANISLADLRHEFSSALAIFAAHVKDIDRKVLTGVDADMAEEPARERLFDVLMRRLELLAPHRAALKSLMRSVACNPPLALALNGIAVNSQQWM